MRPCAKLNLVLLALAFCTVPVASAEKADRSWNQLPRLSVMTGFIYEPKKPYTIQEWMENLGSRFDADQWVRDFQEIGASHVIFYDKWIDGLVFHDTKTTKFKTKRDFLREIAGACQRGGLPLVIYFNAISDGNPEFDPWALLDREGKAIVFGEAWPTRYQTLHSPFRDKCLQQVREILGNYGPIHGMWFDIFSERLNTTSEWTAAGYQKMLREPFDGASPERLAEFGVRTLADYLDEVEVMRRDSGQEQCMYTANGSGTMFLGGGLWTQSVGARLQYLFNEGHSFGNNESLGRMASALPKHLDVNLLLNTSWFTPLEDVPPPAAYSTEQAIAATAISVCQGAGVNFALTPGHDGRFGEDLQRAKAVGRWFREVERWILDAQLATDVAVVHGPNAAAATEALNRDGFFTHWVALDRELPSSRAIVVPAQSRVDDTMAGRLREYVDKGGTLIIGGHPQTLAELCGVRVKGNAAFAKKLRGASVRVDSEYNEEYRGYHLLDDQPGTAWASDGTPMPHWAEITLSAPGDVAKIELVNRSGAYQIKDVDFELAEGNGWRAVKAVRDETSNTIVVNLDAPTATDRVRVKILREWYQGQDRQYADVDSIRVLDRSGKNLASGEVLPVRLVATASELKDLSLPPSAVDVEPVNANVLARFENAANSPAVLGNFVGRGAVLLVTAIPLVTGGDATFWAAVHKMVLGEPALIVSPEVAQRFRFIRTAVGKAQVLHVIDAAVPATDYQPETIEVSLSKSQLGQFTEARQVGSDTPLTLSEEGGRFVFTVKPAPIATIVFQ